MKPCFFPLRVLVSMSPCGRRGAERLEEQVEGEELGFAGMYDDGASVLVGIQHFGVAGSVSELMDKQELSSSKRTEATLL